MNNPNEYFDTLYKGLEDKWIVLSRFERPVQNNIVSVKHLPDFPELSGQKTNRNLYHTWSVFDSQPLAGGTIEEATAIPGVFLDFDANDKGQYKKDGVVGPSLDDIKSAITSWGLPPWSAIVSTGNGFHFEWRFNQPFFVRTVEAKTRASNFLKQFNAYAIAQGKALSWKLDGMGTLSHPKRVPGSQNWKDKADPKPVVVVDFHPERVYSIEELEAAVPPLPVAVKEVPRKRSPVKESDREPIWDSVVNGCLFAQHIEADANHLAEEDWFAAASLIGVCKDGDKVFHELSIADDRYNHTEAADKLKRAVDDGGPRTCANIEAQLGFNGCKDCLFYGRIRSPISLGYEVPAVAKLIATHVLDNETGRYYDFSRLEPMREDAFRRGFRHLGLKNPPDAFNASKLAIKATRSDYLPGKARLFIDKDRRVVLNTYKPGHIVPLAVPGNCADILEHFKYLFPVEEERTHLLNYFAHLVQYPGIKIGHAMVIMGRKQGTGKSLAASWMFPILGESNIARLSNSLIKDKYTANLADVQLAVVEEMMGDDRLSFYNDIKEWITQEQAMGNQKYTVVKLSRTPRAWLFITNHADPLMLDKFDRRIFAIETEAEPQPKEYYDNLVAVAHTQLPAFYRWLLDKDLSGFNPNARPPSTKAKERMIELAASPVEAALSEAWGSDRGAFKYDYGTLDDVMTTVEAVDPRITVLKRNEVMKALRASGATRIERQIRVEGGRVRLWVWRNPDKWLNATDKDIAANYMPYAFHPSFA